MSSISSLRIPSVPELDEPGLDDAPENQLLGRRGEHHRRQKGETGDAGTPLIHNHLFQRVFVLFPEQYAKQIDHVHGRRGQQESHRSHEGLPCQATRLEAKGGERPRAVSRSIAGITNRMAAVHQRDDGHLLDQRGFRPARSDPVQLR